MKGRREEPIAFEFEGPKSKLTWKFGVGICGTLGVLFVLSPSFHKYIYKFPNDPVEGMEIMGLFFLFLTTVFYGSHDYESKRKILLYEDRVVFIKAVDQVLLEAPFKSVTKLRGYRSRGSTVDRYEVTIEGGKRYGFGGNIENVQDLAKEIENNTNMKF